MKVARFLAKLAPRPVICGLRAAIILLFKFGQTKRHNLGYCLDAQANPIPWMTYPVIDFLKSYDLSECDVFEFGSGSSTLFWAEHCRSVVSVEHCQPWFEKIKELCSDKIKIIPQYDLSEYPAEIHKYGAFDLIVIDGAERAQATRASLNHIKPQGMIIVDNSEWFPNCCKLLREQGFSQYDFCGFTPLNSFTSMTSIFTKGVIAFTYKPKPPFWAPIGGKSLTYYPLDDNV